MRTDLATAMRASRTTAATAIYAAVTRISRAARPDPPVCVSLQNVRRCPADLDHIDVVAGLVHRGRVVRPRRPHLAAHLDQPVALVDALEDDRAGAPHRVDPGAHVRRPQMAEG